MKPTQLLLIMAFAVVASLATVVGYEKYYKHSGVAPKVYAINSKYIVEVKTAEMKQLVMSGKGDSVSEKDVIEYLQTIDSIVDGIAKRDGALVVVAQMVVSKNVKDITREVLDIYNQKSGKAPIKLDENVLK